MFIDEVEIEVEGGTGGNGIISFRREKFVPLGGPNGGSGGRGGDVIFEVDLGLRTLLDFRFNKLYKALDGENGKSKNMNGAAADALVLKVPPGTMVYDAKTDELLFDLTGAYEEEVIARGGRGGRGNSELARVGRHSLEISENGEPGEKRKLRLELKLLADVGLVGLPSVGKSSLISVISKVKPKIGAYHFTTLKPNIGVAQTKDGETFVVADLPGLIEGAHLGKGLGLQFLRHIERTKIILHVLDMGGSEGRDPLDDFKVINKELRSYKMNLETKKMIVVANKMDLPDSEGNLERFKEKYPEYEVYPISTVTRAGLDDLLYAIVNTLNNEKIPVEIEEPIQKIYEFKSEVEFYIEVDENNVYHVTGPAIERLIAMTNFNTYDNIRRFSNQLKAMGIEDELRRLGAKEGDTVDLDGYEFEFLD